MCIGKLLVVSCCSSALHGRKAPSVNGAATLTQEQRTRASRTVSTAPTGGGMHDDAAAGTAEVWCHSRRCSAPPLTGVSAASGLERRGGPGRNTHPLAVHLYYVCTM